MTQERPCSIAAYEQYYARQLDGAHGLTRASEDFVRLLVRGGIAPGKVDEPALDFGIGDGRHAEYLISMGYRVTGTDVSDAPLQVSNRRLLGTGKLQTTLLERSPALPFPDRAYSLVVAWEVMHWLGGPESWELAIREFIRVLRPGGHLILTMPTERHYLKRHSLEVGKSTYLCKTPERMDCRFYSPNLLTLKHLFERDFGLSVRLVLCYENGSTVTEQTLEERFSMYGFLLALPTA